MHRKEPMILLKKIFKNFQLTVCNRNCLQLPTMQFHGTNVVHKSIKFLELRFSGGKFINIFVGNSPVFSGSFSESYSFVNGYLRGNLYGNSFYDANIPCILLAQYIKLIAPPATTINSVITFAAIITRYLKM